jgi:hypothetical protein
MHKARKQFDAVNNEKKYANFQGGLEYKKNIEKTCVTKTPKERGVFSHFLSYLL